MIEHTGRAEWYDRIELQRSEWDAVDKAKASIAASGEAVTTGRVVGEVNLGFWVRLFSSAYDKTVWSRHLKGILPAGTQRGPLYSRLQSIKTLRNRIAHHQRIIGGKRDLRRDYEDLIETISWISPEMALWVSDTNCFLCRAEKKLRKLAKPEPHDMPKTSEPTISN